jgi:hypothetical protein
MADEGLALRPAKNGAPRIPIPARPLNLLNYFNILPREWRDAEFLALAS